jgi:hypothetical protein
MPDALWVVTRESNLGGYNTWVRGEGAAEAASLGLRQIMSRKECEKRGVDPNTCNTAVVQVPRMLPQTDNKGNVSIQKTDVREFIRTIVGEYVVKAQKGETKARGIVFDELSILAKWVYDMIKERERNGFEVIAQIKEWVGEMCEISTMSGLPMAFLCHSKDTTFWEDGPKKGKVKYKGGPAMPVGTMIADVCALPDAVLQVDLEETGMDSSTRVIRTEAHPRWERKCRVWGVEPTIEPDLRPLLTKAGWNFQTAA